jgi:hypothetical protein
LRSDTSNLAAEGEDLSAAENDVKGFAGIDANSTGLTIRRPDFQLNQ